MLKYRTDGVSYEAVPQVLLLSMERCGPLYWR